ncbi:MAG: PAS domain S-box protein, partial [Gallionella sp.]|nr:PAS domain S-box protein [Gallionella sp.]
MKIYFNSLKTRLVVVLLCIALLPGIAASLIAHHLMFNNLKADRIMDVELVADAKRDQLVRMLTRQNIQAKALLQNLSSQCGTTLGKANPVCVKNLLESNLATEYALGISLYDNTGGRLNVGESATLQPQDSLLPAGQLARFSGNGTELNRSFFIAVADAKSGYRLVVTYPSSVLESIFFPYPANLGNSGETFLTDGAGYFVTRHKYTSTQGHNHPISARPLQACLGGQSGKLLDKDYRDADIIHGFRFVPELGSACIMAHITQEEAFAPLRLLEQRLIAALLVCALLLAITAVYLARRIARPVSNLTQVARNIAAGNYQVKADETGSDELAQLAVSFNSMTRKLRESAKLLEAVVEHIPVMVFVKRASDLRIELFNRAGAELTGYPQESLIGKGNYDLWPKEEGDFFTAADRKVLASHEVTEIAEEPITRANGEIRLLQTWKVALRDEHDEPTHMLGISIDITERKQAEQKILQFNAELEQRVAARTAELNDTTTRIQTILNTVSDGIITINSRGMVCSLNPAAERLFGYAASEVIGQNINMLMPEPYHAQHDGYLERYRATGKEYVIGTLREVAGVRRDGSTFPIEIAVSKMQLGDELHFVGIVRDISARKQAKALQAKNLKELADFKTALDDHAIVAIADVRGNITYANDKFCAISKYTRAELLG